MRSEVNGISSREFTTRRGCIPHLTIDLRFSSRWRLPQARLGGLASLVQRYRSKVIAHQLDRAGIEGENNDLTAAAINGIDYQPVKVDILMKGEAEKLQLGDLEFNFVHTPGHTLGSMSPYIDTKAGRVLFGQDIHGPFSPTCGSDLAAWRKSMEKLLALKADVLCEGHAGVFKGEMVSRYIEAYLERYRV